MSKLNEVKDVLIVMRQQQKREEEMMKSYGKADFAQMRYTKGSLKTLNKYIKMLEGVLE